MIWYFGGMLVGGLVGMGLSALLVVALGGVTQLVGALIGAGVTAALLNVGGMVGDAIDARRMNREFDRITSREWRP